MHCHSFQYHYPACLKDGSRPWFGSGVGGYHLVTSWFEDTGACLAPQGSHPCPLSHWQSFPDSRATWMQQRWSSLEDSIALSAELLYCMQRSGIFNRDTKVLLGMLVQLLTLKFTDSWPGLLQHTSKVSIAAEAKILWNIAKRCGKWSLINITAEWLWSRKVQRSLYFCVNKWGTAGTQHSAGPDIFIWLYSAVPDPAIALAANRFQRQHSAGTGLGVETYDLLSESPGVHLGILGQFL